jgi:hypothetical protein
VDLSGCPASGEPRIFPVRCGCMKPPSDGAKLAFNWVSGADYQTASGEDVSSRPVKKMKRALSVLIFGFPCVAQQYVISTYAGGAPPIATPAAATSVSIGAPISVVAGGVGNVFFASPQLNAVYQVDASGSLTLVAGNSKVGYSGDGGPATAAKLNIGFGNESALSSGLALDQSGNLYLADTGNHCVRRVSPKGIITTIAGTGKAGFSGDGGPAANAQLAYRGVWRWIPRAMSTSWMR